MYILALLNVPIYQSLGAITTIIIYIPPGTIKLLAVLLLGGLYVMSSPSGDGE